MGKLIRVGARCRMCGKMVEVDLTEKQFSRFQLWEMGVMHIQQAIPEVPAGIREVFISGTCEECWEKMFEGMDDEEDD